MKPALGWSAAPVDFACRRPRIVVAIAFCLTIAAAVFTAATFSIHTEITALIPADVPWRAHEQALEKAFVSQGDDIVVVIDARTPELASDAANRLAVALSGEPGLFRRVDQPEGGPFFDREGALFLPEPQVRDLADALIRAQPLIGRVAADPSLRGVLGSLTTAADAAGRGEASAADLSPVISAMTDVADSAAHGQPEPLAWRPLMTGAPPSADDLRGFVIVFPRLDYSRQDPAEAAIGAVRAAAVRLGIDEAHGYRVRLTGEVPMESDELATLREATGPIAAVSLGVVLVLLYFATRSWRIVGCILGTVGAGLALTAAFGLAVYGRFNLISIAFLPLFVGLSVDFAIQVCVRYRAESLSEPDPSRAIVRAASAVGPGLAIAATAIALGFLSFLPTRYKAVSELGLTAGFGMVIALALSLSLLPALLVLTRARSPAGEKGFPGLRLADRALQRRRRDILIGFGALSLAALALGALLRFDFDPLSLRSPKRESVATFLELVRNPRTAPDAMDILAPDLTSARRIAAGLKARPEVREALTVESLVPQGQAPKLAILSDAALLLDPTLNPFDVAPPPSDGDLKASLKETATALRALAASPKGGVVPDAGRLADLFARAEAGTPADRARLQTVMVAGLPRALEQVRALLSATPVDLQTLPAELRSDWLTPDGRARVEVLPVATHRDAAGLAAFVRSVAAIAPDATGGPRAIAETRTLVLGAFGEAAILSLVTVALLLVAALRSVVGAVLTLIPVLLSGMLAVGTCVLIGQAINLENLIALPLLFGIGVSFNIYFVVAWRRGERGLLRSSLTRAIAYSAVTTGAAFGALGLSKHPGTASMGVLLLVSLAWTLATTFLVQPALLGLVWRQPGQRGSSVAEPKAR